MVRFRKKLLNIENSASDKRGQLELYSLEELYGILSNLLAKGDYESATILRDTINKKEQE